MGIRSTKEAQHMAIVATLQAVIYRVHPENPNNETSEAYLRGVVEQASDTIQRVLNVKGMGVASFLPLIGLKEWAWKFTNQSDDLPSQYDIRRFAQIICERTKGVR